MSAAHRGNPRSTSMRKLVALLVLLSVVFGVCSVYAPADARGGRTEDCPKGSTDPDCK
jgi:hypothetical protein